MAIAVGKVNAKWGNKLANISSVRQAVLVDMTFNMGSTNKFPKMEAAINKQDWDTAANEIMDSEYAGDVGDRAKRNACIMRDGTKYTKESQNWDD